jgi:hypothetical protein
VGDLVFLATIAAPPAAPTPISGPKTAQQPLGDGRGLNERGFYDIRGVGEITTIDEFKERAFASQKRSRLQTLEDVTALKKNMNGRSLAKLQWNDCLSFRPRSSIPRISLCSGSQLTHTLQALESMEKAGITDREFLATTLIHDLGKLASLKGEKWENLGLR